MKHFVLLNLAVVIDHLLCSCIYVMCFVSVYSELDNPPVFLRVINKPLAKVRV